MVHICNNVTCSCGTKYCSNCCDGCPGCGKGKAIISVASTTNAEPTIIYMDKPKEDIFKTIMKTPDNHSVPTAKLQLHVEPREDWEEVFEKKWNSIMGGCGVGYGNAQVWLIAFIKQVRKDTLSSVVEKVGEIHNALHNRDYDLAYHLTSELCLILQE